MAVLLLRGRCGSVSWFSVMFTLGLNDLKGFLQPKQFFDSVMSLSSRHYITVDVSSSIICADASSRLNN